MYHWSSLLLFVICWITTVHLGQINGYNNRLQNRFGMHPQVWPFIHFLKNEESLVLIRTIQIRNGNYSDKALPFTSSNERARQKTKQMKNLSRLFEIGSINLKQYVTQLSHFVGESVTTGKKKTDDHPNLTTAIDDDDDDDDVDD